MSVSLIMDVDERTMSLSPTVGTTTTVIIMTTVIALGVGVHDFDNTPLDRSIDQCDDV